MHGQTLENRSWSHDRRLSRKAVGRERPRESTELRDTRFRPQRPMLTLLFGRMAAGDRHAWLTRPPRRNDYAFVTKRYWISARKGRNVSTCLRHLLVEISVVRTRFASSFSWLWGPAPTPLGFSQA